MTNTARAALCAALAILCAGCFLEELKVSCKDSYQDCHALNVANERDDEVGGDCQIYQCREDGRGCELRERDYDGDNYLDPHSCSDTDSKRLDCNDDPDGGREFHPDAGEQCDGVDNNCNGWIDEGALTGAVETRQFPDAISASYAVDRDVLWVALQRGESNPGGATWHTRERSQYSQLVPLDDGCAQEGVCNFRELAVSVNAEYLLALGVDVAACIDGVLRVGARASSETTDPLDWRGSIARGAVGSLPSGIERALSCGPTGRGARSPSIAQSPKSGDASALGLFRAGSTANVGAAPLAAVGLRVQNGSIDLLGGRSLLLDDGVTRGRDAASIAPWNGPRPGYFVSYDSEQGVELAFVVLDQLGDNVAHVQHTRIAEGRGVRAPTVTVAAGRDPETTPRGLAVAWRDGEASASIRFLSLAYAPQRSPFFATIHGPLELARGRDLVEGPMITYVTAGFRTDVSAAGGWFVAWVEGRGALRRVVAVRVDEASGATDPTELVLADDTSGVTNLFAYSESNDNRSKIGYAFLSKSPEQQLNMGSLSCASNE